VLVVVGALTFAGSGGPGWAALALMAVPLLLTWRRLPTSSGLTALVAIRPVAAGVAALVLTSTATSAVVFLVPFVLAGQAGASAASAGLMLTALPLAMVLLGPVGGVLADRWGAGRVALAGAVIIAGGVVLLLPLTTAWSGVGLAWRLAIVGTGMAAFVGPNQTVIMNATPRSALATAGGASGLARSLGFGLGPAVAAAAWASTGYTEIGIHLAIALAATAALGAVAALVILGRRTVPAGRPAIGAGSPR
jgi:MFS family permease